MSEARPTTTVGIATYGRPEYLRQVLGSLAEQRVRPTEILVVDDSHEDATREVVAGFRETFEGQGVDLRYLPRVGSDSMPGARNTVLNCSTSDLVCFVDDDVVCEPTWLESIVTTFEENPAVVAVGGPAIRVDEDMEPTSEIVRDATNRNLINEYGETTSRVENWIPPEPVETQRLGGANMAFRRDVLVELGGFDRAYDLGPAKLEETDLMARLVRRGETLIYHPEALVYHFTTPTGGARATMDRVSLEDRYWFARNAVLFKRKHSVYPLWIPLLRLVLRALLPGTVLRTAFELARGDYTVLYKLRGYVDGVVVDGLRGRGR